MSKSKPRKKVDPLNVEVSLPKGKPRNWFDKLGDERAQQFVREAFACYLRGELKYNVTSQPKFYQWLKAALSEHYPHCPFPNSHKAIGDWMREMRRGQADG